MEPTNRWIAPFSKGNVVVCVTHDYKSINFGDRVTVDRCRWSPKSKDWVIDVTHHSRNSEYTTSFYMARNFVHIIDFNAAIAGREEEKPGVVARRTDDTTDETAAPTILLWSAIDITDCHTTAQIMAVIDGGTRRFVAATSFEELTRKICESLVKKPNRRWLIMVPQYEATMAPTPVLFRTLPPT